MSYNPILQVSARNYARDIIKGEPTKVLLKPTNGQFAYVYNYPQYNRPKVGIVYVPNVEAEVFFTSKIYNWYGVRIGRQYGWVNTKDFLIEVIDEPAPPAPEPEPEPDNAFGFDAEVEAESAPKKRGRKAK